MAKNPTVPAALDMNIYRPTEEWTPTEEKVNSYYQGEPSTPTAPPVPFSGTRNKDIKADFRTGTDPFDLSRKNNTLWRATKDEANPNNDVNRFLNQIIAEDPTNPTIPGGSGLSKLLENNPAMGTWFLNYLQARRRTSGSGL